MRAKQAHACNTRAMFALAKEERTLASAECEYRGLWAELPAGPWDRDPGGVRGEAHQFSHKRGTRS